MKILKKIILFIVGMVIVPFALGKSLSLMVGCEDYKGFSFFSLVFFLLYMIFPFLHRGKIKEKIYNKYVFYVLLYIPFVMLFVWMYL